MKISLRQEILKNTKTHEALHRMKPIPGHRALLHMSINCFECYLFWFSHQGENGQEFNIQASIGQENLAECYSKALGSTYIPGPWNIQLDINAAERLACVGRGASSLIPYSQIKTAVPEFLAWAWTSFFQPYASLDGFAEGLKSDEVALIQRSRDRMPLLECWDRLRVQLASSDGRLNGSDQIGCSDD